MFLPSARTDKRPDRRLSSRLRSCGNKRVAGGHAETMGSPSSEPTQEALRLDRIRGLSRMVWRLKMLRRIRYCAELNRRCLFDWRIKEQPPTYCAVQLTF